MSRAASIAPAPAAPGSSPPTAPGSESSKTPEVPANLCFGGPDMKTLFFTARTSIYSLRVKVPGLPGHPYRRF